MPSDGHELRLVKFLNARQYKLALSYLADISPRPKISLVKDNSIIMKQSMLDALTSHEVIKWRDLEVGEIYKTDLSLPSDVLLSDSDHPSTPRRSYDDEPEVIQQRINDSLRRLDLLSP